MTKTLAADDRNNKAYYKSFVNGHPTWRRWRQLLTNYSNSFGVHLYHTIDIPAWFNTISIFWQLQILGFIWHLCILGITVSIHPSCVPHMKIALFCSFLFTLTGLRFQIYHFPRCTLPALWWYSVCLQNTVHELLMSYYGAGWDRFHISAEMHTTCKTGKKKNINSRLQLTASNELFLQETWYHCLPSQK